MVLGWSWGDPGAVLGRSWAVLGGVGLSCWDLGRSWGHLGRSWAGLGRSVQGSGEILGVFWESFLKNKKQHRAAKRQTMKQQKASEAAKGSKDK